MFECKYKFTLEDNIKCAKYVYKSQKRTQDKVIACMLPILLVCMVALLVVDIVNDKSIIWDIALLVMLFVLQMMYFVMPAMVVKQTKKSYHAQKLDTMDYIKVNINEKSCAVAFEREGTENDVKLLPLKTLTSYLEDGDSIILIFNKVEYVQVKKEHLTGDVNKLKALLNKAMAKANK